jgi:hypothetical protein
MSLVSSAGRNELDVFIYVIDVLDRLLAGETAFDTLRPDAGSPASAPRGHGGGVRSLSPDVRVDGSIQRFVHIWGERPMNARPSPKACLDCLCGIGPALTATTTVLRQ